MNFPGGYGFGPFGHFISAIVGALLGFFIFLVVVAILFLLVRFLIVATRAAHIYVAKNSPAPVAKPAPQTGSAGPAYAPPATTVAAPPTTPAAPPATKQRTPKPPTA